MRGSRKGRGRIVLGSSPRDSLLEFEPDGSRTLFDATLVYPSPEPSYAMSCLLTGFDERILAH
jgi:hypothetical protein